ncbi:hypothetical protein DAKH74_037080 [Maudiozyma humilis]|uniref:Uncharacterized protein n=1 Tax=Maudiozyma humilis TaxID=51915 RepID=A0AAV5S0F7_MAUHU|nr:hypothetical protein DAKH74_037080 [Kazachstania humilis]
MQTNKVFMGCSFLFTLACFLMIIISMAGSTKNYHPLNTIYIGQADISHINVTKVIPEVTPVAEMLGGILVAYPNQTDFVFAALKNVSQTAALLPFLRIVIDANNISATLNSVNALSPLALSATNGSAAADSLTAINELLKESKNTNQTVSGLSALVSTQSSSNATTTEKSIQALLFQVLESSKNASATTDALVDLMDVPLTDLLTLEPALELVQYSSNITATLGAVESLMNVTIPSALATQLFSVLNTTLASTSNVTAAFSSLASLVPSSMSGSLSALTELFTASKNVTKTLSLMETIVAKNLTSSSAAKRVVNDISIILDEATSTTLITTIVSTLMGSLGSSSSSGLDSSMLTMLSSAKVELQDLATVLDASNNSTESVTVIDNMQSTLSSNSDMEQYVPYLFEFLEASNDPAESFQALVNITSFAASNTAVMMPLLKVLSLAAAAPEPTQQQMYEYMPSILDRLHIAVKLRLGIFTLCKTNLEGKVLTCTKPHAVQNFDFRNIMYETLMDSDFAPYLTALDIGADDLQLAGKLMGREHQYVPTVKAALSMDILSFVTGFFLMIAIVYIQCTKCLTTHWRWFSFTFTTMAYCAFTGLGTTVVTAIVNIIKSGTAHDRYNVTVTSNAPNMGMTWCAFALSVLMMWMAMYGWYDFYKKNGRGGLAQKQANDTELHIETSSTSGTDAESRIIKENYVSDEQLVDTHKQQ